MLWPVPKPNIVTYPILFFLILFTLKSGETNASVSKEVAQNFYCSNFNFPPYQAPFILSDGTAIPLPTRSRNGRFLTVYGLAELNFMQKKLQLDHQNNSRKVYPITIGGMSKTLMAISIYDYLDTDMGSFREVYIVTFVSRSKNLGFENFYDALKAFRRRNNPAPENLLLYHLYAGSTHIHPRLASKEIWGIDNEAITVTQNLMTKNQFDIEVANNRNAKMFQVKIKQPHWLNNLWGYNYQMLATGAPQVDGPFAINPAESLVQSCGLSFLGPFQGRKNKITWAKDTFFGKNLSNLNFYPLWMEYAEQTRAIQYPPNSLEH